MLVRKTLRDRIAQAISFSFHEEGYIEGESDPSLWDEFLKAADQVLIEVRQVKDRIDRQLNDNLCEMKEGYDDSIVGFNEAWDIVRKIFKEELDAQSS